MRVARVKVDAGVGEACYHLMSRVVGGERLLDVRAREVLRKHIWQVAEFCGIEVLTYAVMPNHFHVLVRVPQREVVSDVELLRRFTVLHPFPTRIQQAEMKRVGEGLKSSTSIAVDWRRRQLEQMYDVSAFMKLLKQRFSIWFNRKHKRFGTLWAERFKSVVVEDRATALLTVAAYIDLNPVRAGLVNDPAEYRFCGYGEAVGGTERARMGLARVMPGSGNYMRDYRQVLFGKGAKSLSGKASLPKEKLDQTVRDGGRIPLALALRYRVKFLSDGVLFGSRDFVEKMRNLVPRLRPQSGRKSSPATAPPLFACVPEWKNLQLGHKIRGPALG